MNYLKKKSLIKISNKRERKSEPCETTDETEIKLKILFLLILSRLTADNLLINEPC